MISGKPTQPCLHDGSSRKEVISIADKKFRGRDKIVQKMTKDGLVDENLRTGEQKSTTAEEKPEQEDSAKETAKKEADEEPIVDEELCMDAEDEEDVPRHHSTAKQSADYYKAHQEDFRYSYIFSLLLFFLYKQQQAHGRLLIAIYRRLVLSSYFICCSFLWVKTELPKASYI